MSTSLQLVSLTVYTDVDMSLFSALTQGSGRVGFKFASTTDSGAFVMLEPPGKSCDIESKRHIVNHMRENFHHWLNFANGEDSYGLDLKEHDLIFVCGTTKTTRWAVAAFQGNTFRKKEGHVTGDFGPFATVGLSVNISNQILPTNHYRTGPRRVTNALCNDGSAAAPAGPTQCLFIHYYKMRRRVWLFKEPIRAAAGPDNLPPGPRDPEFGEAMMVDEHDYEFEPDGVHGVGKVRLWLFGMLLALTDTVSQAYDPVTPLLDYILRVSLFTKCIPISS